MTAKNRSAGRPIPYLRIHKGPRAIIAWARCIVVHPTKILGGPWPILQRPSSSNHFQTFCCNYPHWLNSLSWTSYDTFYSSYERKKFGFDL